MMVKERQGNADGWHKLKPVTDSETVNSTTLRPGSSLTATFDNPRRDPSGGTSRGSKQNAVRRISRTHTYIMSSYLRTHIPTRDADCVALAFGQTHRRHLPPTSNHFPSMATFPRTGTLPYACPSTTPNRIPHSSGFESGE